MKKRKVLHIIENLDVAGAQTVVMNYLRNLTDDPQIDINLAVIGAYNRSKYVDEVIEKKYPVRFYHYKPYSAIPIISSVLNWIRYQRLVLKAIKEISPDIIHSHQTNILPYVCFPMWLTRKAKLFHTLHSDPYAVSEKIMRIARFAFNKLGIYPVCVTEIQAEKALRKYGFKTTTVVHNGLDEKAYLEHYCKADIRKEFAVPDDSFVIGCVGRLDKIKNHCFLFQIFSKYVKINPKARLLVVGDGSERNNLKRLVAELKIEDQVIFTGLQSNVARLYQIMDLFMLTSLFESSSIVTVEAQLSGVRCVISSSIPNSVVIRDGVNRVSLDAPEDQWLAAIENKLPYDKVVNEVSFFTMSNTTVELKQLYGL